MPACSSPAATLSSVDFPQPVGPTMATNSPCSTVEAGAARPRYRPRSRPDGTPPSRHQARPPSALSYPPRLPPPGLDDALAVAKDKFNASRVRRGRSSTHAPYAEAYATASHGPQLTCQTTPLIAFAHVGKSFDGGRGVQRSGGGRRLARGRRGRISRHRRRLRLRQDHAAAAGQPADRRRRAAASRVEGEDVARARSDPACAAASAMCSRAAGCSRT